MTKEEIIATVRGNNHVVVWLTEQFAYLHIPFNDISVLWDKPEAAIKLVKKTVSELGFSVDDILFVEGVNSIAALNPQWDGSDTFVCEDPSCKVAHSVDQMLADRLLHRAFPEAKWYQLGWQASEAGDYEKAVGAFHEVVRLKPGLAQAWYSLGSAYGHLGQHDQAVTACQEAVRLKPDWAEAWYNLGRRYSDLGQHDQAVRAYQEAIRLKPDLVEAWNNLGVACARQGNRAKVMQAYEKLKTLDPNMADKFFQKFVLP